MGSEPTFVGLGANGNFGPEAAETNEPRNVRFRSGTLNSSTTNPLILMDSGVKFLACDMPELNDLRAAIMALVAQQEREAISKRTTSAV